MTKAISKQKELNMWKKNVSEESKNYKGFVHNYPFTDKNGYEWYYCVICEAVVPCCPVCDENICSGNIGILENGEKCDFCYEASKYWDRCIKNQVVPIFSKRYTRKLDKKFQKQKEEWANV